MPSEAFVDVLAPILDDLSRDPYPKIVAVAGSVAVGKTTFANSLSTVLSEVLTRPASIVSTDGFLHGNIELQRRGSLMRKGFPESYDHEAIRRTVQAIRANAWPLEVPRYSHERFDIDGTALIDKAEIVIVEGINALQEPLGLLADVRLYLEADEATVRGWFVDRLVGCVEDARAHPGGFYDRFVAWDDPTVREFAVSVWNDINLPNLREHIGPSAANADWVLDIGDTHRLISARRNPRSGDPTKRRARV